MYWYNHNSNWQMAADILFILCSFCYIWLCFIALNVLYFIATTSRTQRSLHGRHSRSSWRRLRLLQRIPPCRRPRHLPRPLIVARSKHRLNSATGGQETARIQSSRRGAFQFLVGDVQRWRRAVPASSAHFLVQREKRLDRLNLAAQGGLARRPC